MAAAGSKPLTLVIQLGLVAFLLFRAADTVLSVPTFNTFQATRVRFLPLELRDPAALPALVKIGAFGLMKDACPLPPGEWFTPNTTAPAAPPAAGTGTRREGNVTVAAGGGGWAVEVVYAATVAANGYYFVTSPDAGSERTDPVRWRVEASADGGGTWRTVGASGWVPETRHSSAFLPHVRLEPPAAPRGQAVRVDMRAGWPLVLIMSARGFELATALLCSIAAGATGRVHLIRPLYVAGIGAGVVLDAVAAAGAAAAHDASAARIWWAYTGAYAVLFFGILLSESRIVLWALLYAASFFAAAVYDNVAVYGTGWAAVAGAVVLSPATAALLFSLTIFLFRRAVVARARRLVVKDRSHYDAVWADILARPETPAALASLQSATAALSLRAAQDSPAAGARQYNRMGRGAAGPPLVRSFAWVRGIVTWLQAGCLAVARGRAAPAAEALSARPAALAGPARTDIAAWTPGTGGTVGTGKSRITGGTMGAGGTGGTGGTGEVQDDSGLGIPGTLDVQAPVDNLDQLFVQARCLHPMLIDKCKGWAAASRGCFAAAAKPVKAFLPWYDEGSGAAAGRLVRFAEVKSVARCVEKAYRSYSQDVSRLVDICRQAVVFETLTDLLACLGAIHSDSDVQIVRVKDRLGSSYDGAATAGYRDVALNLRLVHAAACALGAETHVCEVQLLLRRFAELKEAVAHLVNRIGDAVGAETHVREVTVQLTLRRFAELMSDEGHKRYVAFRNLRGE